MKSIIAILGILTVLLPGIVMAEEPVYIDFPHYPVIPENISTEKPIYTDFPHFPAVPENINLEEPMYMDFPHYYADAKLWDGIPVVSMITCLDSRAAIGKSTEQVTNISSLIVSMRDRLYQAGLILFISTYL